MVRYRDRRRRSGNGHRARLADGNAIDASLRRHDETATAALGGASHGLSGTGRGSGRAGGGSDDQRGRLGPRGDDAWPGEDAASAADRGGGCSAGRCQRHRSDLPRCPGHTRGDPGRPQDGGLRRVAPAAAARGGDLRRARRAGRSTGRSGDIRWRTVRGLPRGSNQGRPG